MSESHCVSTKSIAWLPTFPQILCKQFVPQATVSDQVNTWLVKQTALILLAWHLAVFRIKPLAVLDLGHASTRVETITANHQANGWCHTLSRHTHGHMTTALVLLTVLIGSSRSNMAHKISETSSPWLGVDSNTIGIGMSPFEHFTHGSSYNGNLALKNERRLCDYGYRMLYRFGSSAGSFYRRL